MESILNSIKKMIGIDPSYTVFDVDIITHINSVFAILIQLGVGPSTGYSITNANDTWTDFLDEDPRLEMVKSFMALKVRLLFDPPSSSTHVEVINQSIKELEWRLNIASESLN